MILWKNFICAWSREENQGNEPGSRDRQILKMCLWKGWQSGPEHFSLEFLIIFPNCQYGGKLPKKARGLLWGELSVEPLCPTLGFGNSIPSLCTTRVGGNGRNHNLSFSPSKNISNVFVSCLHLLLAAWSFSSLTCTPNSPHPHKPVKPCCSKLKKKTIYPGWFIIKVKFYANLKVKEGESQVISKFILKDRQSDAPQTTTSVLY